MIFIFRRFKKREFIRKRLVSLAVRTGICALLLFCTLAAAQNATAREAISRQLLYEIDFADFLIKGEALLKTLFPL